MKVPAAASSAAIMVGAAFTGYRNIDASAPPPKWSIIQQDAPGRLHDGVRQTSTRPQPAGAL